MVLTPFEQIKEIIKRSKNVLVILHGQPSTDAIASGLGLLLALEKLKKRVKIVAPEFELPPYHNFLPKSKEITTELSALKKFVISLDVSKIKVEELSYDIADDKLNVYITPKNGYFEAKDISTSSGKYEYDLVFILECPDLESLGKVYDNNAEFFYNTPVVNIDHSPINEHYGQINLIDLTATSLSEIIFELVRTLGENILDEYIATNLLAGIITKTKSFQTPTVTPKSLAIASHLISSGARREEIIKNLYQTKTIGILKLWGRALARLKEDYGNRLVWSTLTHEDFERSGAEDKDIEGVIDELIVNVPEAEIMALLYQKKDKIRGLVFTIRSIDGRKIFQNFNPGGNRDFTKITFQERDLAEAEQRLLETVKDYYTKMKI
jgi:phosphoesterase RecJ-like protein